jgi:hypothetical protein
MTHTHTPGPFPLTIRKSDSNVPHVIITNQGNHYASTYDLSAARLIAAAPDMLEALIQTVDALGFWFPRWGDPGGAASEMMNQARAAIAKATGNA